MSDEQFQFIRHKLNEIDERTEKMAVSQAQFDTDLAGLVTQIGTLITAVDALIALTPAADLTAEDNSVAAAAASVQAEIAKLAPKGATVPPPPAPATTAAAAKA